MNEDLFRHLEALGVPELPVSWAPDVLGLELPELPEPWVPDVPGLELPELPELPLGRDRE